MKQSSQINSTKWINRTIAAAVTALAAAGFAVPAAYAADPQPPATRPATQPATQPNANIDWKKAAATIEALGGVWASLHEAVEKDDLDTAAQLAGDLIKETEAFRDRVKGTIIAVPVNVALTQLGRLEAALKAKDKEKAKTLISGLDQIGSKIAETIQSEAEPKPGSNPAEKP